MRIPTEELFRIGPTGLEPVSDETITRLLDTYDGYAEAVREEMLKMPEAV